MLFGQMATRTRMTGFTRRNNRVNSIVISFRKARQIFAGLFFARFIYFLPLPLYSFINTNIDYEVSLVAGLLLIEQKKED